MKLTLIQTHLYWEDREKNLAHFDALINSVEDDTELIILPEMFTTGFSMNPQKVAEPHQSEAWHWLKQKAKEKNAIITGSVAVEEKGNYYNRLMWAEPSGKIVTYDKRHLFRMANEDDHYTAGKQKITCVVDSWKVRPMICYDLRFPVWSRNRFVNGSWEYDVLIYVANWPEARSYAWRQLLVARAIENQCYVVGVNRIGKDGNKYAHCGDSMVINPRGEIISKTKANQESVETVALDRNYLDEYRKLFPVGLDADDFDLK